MKLYSAAAPNPRRVCIFLAEKGLEIERVELDLAKGDARAPTLLALNSLGKVPVLELDDGRAIAESVSICRYLETLHPDPPLFGVDDFDRAQVDMWNRRLELEVFQVVGSIALHTFPFFEDRIEQIPAFAEAQRTVASKTLMWLDEAIGDGRDFLAGDRFSIADVTGMATFWLSERAGVEVPDELVHLCGWLKRVQDRPSWSA